MGDDGSSSMDNAKRSLGDSRTVTEPKQHAPQPGSKTAMPHTFDEVLQHNRMSSTLGFDENGASTNRCSLFAAAGLNWPDTAPLEEETGRKSNYPFSIDLSNNRILASVDREGTIHRVATALGVEDVRAKTIPGVYVYKKMAFCQGQVGLTLTMDTQAQPLAGMRFVNGTVPEFSFHCRGIEVHKLVFAPQKDDQRPLCIIQYFSLTNRGQEKQEVTAHTIVSTMEAEDTYPLSVHTGVVTPNRMEIGKNDIDIEIEPGETTTLAFLADFSSDESSLKNFCTMHACFRAMTETLTSRKNSLGSVTTSDAPWYGEQLTRAAELARQSLLLLEDGKAAGSFWGSNANTLSDVWTRDFGYTALGLLDSEPELASTMIEFLAAYGIPKQAWEREATLHPDATGFEHSLGNSCLAAVLASLFIQRHGRQALQLDRNIFLDYLQQLATSLIEKRPERGNLYRTLYISDGPSRGDYHTGSNILAWKAADALTKDFRYAISDRQAGILESVAQNLFDAINNRCACVINGQSMFVEGVNEDGTIIGVHDGEESDLTLACVYGFTSRDDERIRNHARWAHSKSDPYYAPVTGGIDFWDFDDSNGITYPGHIHGLCRANTRKEFETSLEEIRRTTDLDGSFWWWPFKHAETDPAHVKRGLGKCGWCAGEYVSYFLHDIMGVERDERSRSITIAPYTPWNSFKWEGLGFCGGTVDFHQDGNSLSFTNHTDGILHVTLQVALQPDSMLEDVQVNGESRRYQAEVLRLHDGSSVRVHEEAEHGQKVTLQVKTA